MSDAERETLRKFVNSPTPTEDERGNIISGNGDTLMKRRAREMLAQDELTRPFTYYVMQANG